MNGSNSHTPNVVSNLSNSRSMLNKNDALGHTDAKGVSVSSNRSTNGVNTDRSINVVNSNRNNNVTNSKSFKDLDERVKVKSRGYSFLLRGQPVPAKDNKPPETAKGYEVKNHDQGPML